MIRPPFLPLIVALLLSITPPAAQGSLLQPVVHVRGGDWREVTEASFSHDPTGKSARLDRGMGLESGCFFLAHGGFAAGATPFGEKFTRPATGRPPADIDLSKLDPAR